MTGRSDSDEHSGYATIKYSSSGDSLWIARYDCPGSDDERPTAIAVDDLGNVYVTGAIGEYGKQNCITVKYDSSGIEQWAVTYGMAENSDDQPIALAVDKFENKIKFCSYKQFL